MHENHISKVPAHPASTLTVEPELVLHVLHPDGRTEEVSLRNPLRIGSDVLNDLPLPDDHFAAPQHLTLRTLPNGAIAIEDKSEIGVFVRARRSATCGPDDVLLVGSTILRIATRGSGG